MIKTINNTQFNFNILKNSLLLDFLSTEISYVDYNIDNKVIKDLTIFLTNSLKYENSKINLLENHLNTLNAFVFNNNNSRKILNKYTFHTKNLIKTSKIVIPHNFLVDQDDFLKKVFFQEVSNINEILGEAELTFRSKIINVPEESLL